MINKEFILWLSNHLKFVESRPIRESKCIEIVGDNQNDFEKNKVRLSDFKDKLRGSSHPVVFNTAAVIQLLDEFH